MTGDDHQEIERLINSIRADGALKSKSTLMRFNNTYSIMTHLDHCH